MVTLSIITVNLNNKIGLRRTLESFRRIDKCPGIEFICIDGGSTDGSLADIEKFYIRENYVTEKDSGIYHAMNKGLNRATGVFALWLNSGDEIHHRCDICSIVKDLSKKYSDSDIISYALECLPSPGDVESKVWVPDIADLPSWTLPHPSTIFRRSTVVDLGGYNENLRIAADRDLILRLFLKNKKILFGDKILSVFYLDGVSSKKNPYLENLKVDYYNGLVDSWHYYMRTVKFYSRHLLHKLLDKRK